jgi:hypothetical protein
MTWKAYIVAGSRWPDWYHRPNRETTEGMSGSGRVGCREFKCNHRTHRFWLSDAGGHLWRYLTLIYFFSKRIPITKKESVKCDVGVESSQIDEQVILIVLKSFTTLVSKPLCPFWDLNDFWSFSCLYRSNFPKFYLGLYLRWRIRWNIYIYIYGNYSYSIQTKMRILSLCLTGGCSFS